jgi:hypothetical protein
LVFKVFRYHREGLGLSPTSLDQCLLCKRDKNQELQALVSMQVDDSIAVGDAAYFALDEEKVSRFQHKPAKTLRRGSPIVLNGATIHNDDCGLKLVQDEHVNKLIFDAEEKPQAKFASVRALGSYVATISRPDVLSNFQLLSGNSNPSKREVYRLAATCTRTRSIEGDGLSFLALDLGGPLKMVVFSDAGLTLMLIKQVKLVILLRLWIRPTKLTSSQTRRKNVEG